MRREDQLSPACRSLCAQDGLHEPSRNVRMEAELEIIDHEDPVDAFLELRKDGNQRQ